MNPTEHLRAVVTVRGNVQGVLFRTSTKTAAQRLGVTGYAENLSNGDVLIIAEGPRPRLEELSAWCQRGPEFASVDSCTVEWQTATNSFRDFTIR